MELQLPPNLTLLLLIYLLSSSAAGAGAASRSLSSTPLPPPTATSTPKRRPLPSHIGDSAAATASTLDPKQLAALRSMKFPTTKDPCSIRPPHSFATCDDSTPFRRVVGLTLAKCSPDLVPSTAALRALSSSLVSLSFVRCPISSFHIPSSLVSNLRSFSAVSSFGKLTGVYLSHLSGLTDLVVTDVTVQASGVAIVLSEMQNLRSVKISNTKIPGGLPHKWNCLKVKSVDLSMNGLDGPVHPSIGRLKKLEFLSLSSNALTGKLPQTLANLASLKIASFSHNSLIGPLPDLLSELPGLVHLDVSYNHISGSVPMFLTKMKGLKYLNLEHNNFHGVLPFDVSFIKKLDVIKLGGNSNLCYNHTLLSSKLKLGIAPCDKNGMPLSPPPDRHASSLSSDDNSNNGGRNKGHHGPNKKILVVAIGLTCLVFLVIFIVCVSKMCR